MGGREGGREGGIVSEHKLHWYISEAGVYYFFRHPSLPPSLPSFLTSGRVNWS